jgi:tetratricopeptide (TPR) repeat protein
MATPLKIAEMALALSVIVFVPPLFGRDVPSTSVPTYSVARSEGCIPADANLAKRTNVQNAGTTVSVSSLLVPQSAIRAYEHAADALARGKLEDAQTAVEKAIAIDPESAVLWCLMGIVHEEELQLETASADYSRALTADSRMLPAYLGLARIAYRNKRWQDVAKLTETVERIDAIAFPVAYLYNAVANLQMEALRKAERSARIFQSLDTGHERPQVYFLLADILMREGDYAAAAAEEKAFLAIVPNPSSVPNGRDAESIREEIKTLEGRSMRK